MKKSVAVLIVVSMILMLFACSNATTGSTAPSTDAPSTVAPSTTAQTQTVEKKIEWPTETVQLYVAASAGGGTDLVARATANYLSKYFGKTFVVVNQTSGGGAVAYDTVRNARPDGHNLVYYHAGMLCAYAMGQYKSSPVDDFQTCSLGICTEAGGYGMCISADSPYNTLEEFLAGTKSNPGMLLGTQLGGQTEVVAGLFVKETGAQVELVEAGSDTDKISALLGGHIDMAVVGVGTTSNYLKSGDVKVLGFVSSASVRNPKLPDTPTFEELGYPGIKWVNMNFILAPKNTDPAIAKMINEAMILANDDAEYQEHVKKSGFDFVFTGVEESKSILSENLEKIKGVVASLG